MSDAARLIEKLSLAIHGERPELVVTVLAAFVRELCATQGVAIGEFVRVLQQDDGDLDPGDEPS